MIEKYGKDIDFSVLGRDPEFIADRARTFSGKCEELLSVSGTVDVLRCPVCSNEGKKYISIYGYHYYKCLNCGHVYIRNRPADLSALYADGSKTQNAIYSDDDIFIKRCEMISSPKVEFVTQSYNEIAGKIASDNSRKKTWLDLGCGVGEILYEAGRHGWIASGYDADPDEIKFAQGRGLSAHRCVIKMPDPAEEIIDAIKKADVISLFNIIEHVPNPREWVEAIAANMGKNACLVIDTPREPSLTRVMNIACRAYSYKHLIPPEHINVFTEQSLALITANTGLEMAAKWCFGSGFSDLLDSVMLLSGNPDIFLYNDDFQDIRAAINSIQRTIDENGLANNMLCIFMKTQAISS